MIMQILYSSAIVHSTSNSARQIYCAALSRGSGAALEIPSKTTTPHMKVTRDPAHSDDRT